MLMDANTFRKKKHCHEQWNASKQRQEETGNQKLFELTSSENVKGEG